MNSLLMLFAQDFPQPDFSRGEVVYQVHHNGAESLIGIGFVLLMLALIFVIGWVLPIMIGVRAAKRKLHSPLWMLFGIHPLMGWIACIVMLCLPYRKQCMNCGGFIEQNYRICPRCRAPLDGRQQQPQSSCQPPFSPFSQQPPQQPQQPNPQQPCQPPFTQPPQSPFAQPQQPYPQQPQDQQPPEWPDGSQQ